MKKQTLALFCAMSVLVTGCSTPTNAPAQPDKNSTELVTNTEADPSAANEPGTPAATADGIPSVTYNLISNEYPSGDNETTLLYSSYSLPVVTVAGNQGSSDAINSVFTEHKQSYDDEVAEALKEATSWYGDAPEDFASYGFYYSYDVKRCDDRILSLRSCDDSYCGGAHGYYSYSGWNFDTKTGAKLSLSDIATDKDTLLACAKNYILGQLSLPKYSDMLMMDLADITSSNDMDEYILTDDTWFFTNSGLTFVSNTGVLGSYAAGAFFFTIPYQQLEGLKPEYAYDGPLELNAEIGSTISADLDGNEEMDAVFYDCSLNDDTGEVTATLTVNGTDFSDQLAGMLSDGAVYLQDCKYYIVDLDTSDSFAEIAILDNGPSADPVTHFFRYDKGQLSYLGGIYGLLTDSNTRNNGDGSITGQQLISLLETVTVPVTYVLKNGKLEQKEEDWYYIDDSNLPQEFRSHDILKDVVVYTDKDQNSETVTLTSEDGPVTFPATDDKNWFMLKTKDDQTYYIYLKDFGTLESGDWVNEVFSNLLQAG